MVDKCECGEPLKTSQEKRKGLCEDCQDTTDKTEQDKIQERKDQINKRRK